MSGQVPEQRWMGSGQVPPRRPPSGGGQVPMHRPASPPPVETISEADYYVTDGVAVDPNYYWRDMSSCPRRVKVHLLTKGGVAAHGSVTDESIGNYKGWTPLPKCPAILKTI